MSDFGTDIISVRHKGMEGQILVEIKYFSSKIGLIMITENKEKQDLQNVVLKLEVELNSLKAEKRA